MLFNFVWENRIHYLRQSVIMNSYENGGLNLLDFTTLNHAFKISWIKSYLKNPSSMWNSFSHYIFSNLGGLNFILLCNYNVDKIPMKLSEFHEQALLSWTQLINIISAPINSLYETTKTYFLRTSPCFFRLGLTIKYFWWVGFSANRVIYLDMKSFILNLTLLLLPENM